MNKIIFFKIVYDALRVVLEKIGEGGAFSDIHKFLFEDFNTMEGSLAPEFNKTRGVLLTADDMVCTPFLQRIFVTHNGDEYLAVPHLAESDIANQPVKVGFLGSYEPKFIKELPLVVQKD